MNGEIRRGEIWWADLPEPRGDRRPVFVVQTEAFNRSRIQTAIMAVITSNLPLRRQITRDIEYHVRWIRGKSGNRTIERRDDCQSRRDRRIERTYGRRLWVRC